MMWGLKYNWKHLSILYYKKSSLNFLMKTPSLENCSILCRGIKKNYILDILETKFLLETNLDNNQIKLIINDRNLLPPLNDFFKKFSSSSSSSTSSSSSSLVQTIETDSSFFLNLFNFIGNLVNVANSQELILEQANSINDTISIF